MALINCPECGKQISDKAKFCPHCGYDPNTTINRDDFEIEDGVLKKYKGFLDNMVVIPNNVTKIGNDAFMFCGEFTSVMIPDSVTNIGENAFEGCVNLTSITIPDSVTSIGDCAFFSCTGLTSVTIPDSVTSIGYRAFENTAWYNNQPDGLIYAGKVAYEYKGICPSSITIKEGTLGIADSAFMFCDELTSVMIPDSVTNIGEDAFEGCENLTSITIPDSVTSIGDCAFSGCTELTSVTIPDSVTSIGYRAFYDTAWYNNHPDGLVYAGKVAYRYKGECPANVTIKEGTLGIANHAFAECESLTSITIPDSVTRIGAWAFSECESLTSITIPDSVTRIGAGAFSGCKSLAGITIPNSVTVIYEETFSNCDFLTVTIPNSVTDISGGDAFWGCWRFAILCRSGSYAEEFAIENNIDYEIMD